jgi:hypothetical protein
MGQETMKPVWRDHGLKPESEHYPVWMIIGGREIHKINDAEQYAQMIASTGARPMYWARHLSFLNAILGVVVNEDGKDHGLDDDDVIDRLGLR